MRALVSQRVVVDGEVRPAAVLIEGERVAEVRPPDAVPDGVPVEDLGAHVLMAGLVDTHVHVDEPGRTEWEGWRTASAAAAAGGVTTIVDMPLNSTPVTTSVEALEVKARSAEGALHVDVGFWGGVVPGNAADLAQLAREGALGAKAFLCHSGIDDFPASDEDTLRAAMRVMRDAGVPLLAHAELELPGFTPPAHDPRSYAAWLGARPREMEDRAIALLIRLCRETRCPVHVVHLSSASALPMIADAKSEGLPFTVETCPHYLCLRAEDVADGATEYKCAPPIREDANREALWRGLLDGVIDFVVTDHSPCVPQLKAKDFLEAWGGISSLSLGLSSVWTEASTRGARVVDVARWMSEAPARFAGLAGRKGRIAPGKHADLVAWDPEARFEVRADALRFRHKVSPYIGKTLSGVVHATWLRGARVGDAPRGAPLYHREEPS
ncbi:MAG: allantoinase AllB [Sandaracinaceae bacterium]|nr:allantoinase AllB [Sandaracinaceae bacterium]